MQFVAPLAQAVPAHEMVTGTPLAASAVSGPLVLTVPVVPTWAVFRPTRLGLGAWVTVTGAVDLTLNG